MYNNPYYPQMNNQATLDQNYLNMLDKEKERLEKMKEQYMNRIHQPTPTNLTQNFQITPTNREIIKYATSINEVQREMVMGETPYFSKDMSVVWIKDTKGNIKTYELTEIVPKDEKDLTIEMLQEEIQKLKGMIKDEQHLTNNDGTDDETSTTKDDGTTRTTTKTSKPSSVSRVSKSKTK